MKFTVKKGLFRLVLVAALVLVCLPLAKDVELYITCTISFLGLLVCWIIGGFFDTE